MSGADAARTAAMLLIFAFHFSAVFLRGGALPASPFIDQVTRVAGPYGTNVLLILSGYFTYTSLARIDSARAFVLRRFLRLQVPLAIVLGTYLLISLAVPERSRLSQDPLEAAAQIVQTLLLVHGVMSPAPIITVTWTITYIFLFTVALALAFRLLQISRWPLPAALCFYAGTAAGLAVCTPTERVALLVIGAAAGHAGLSRLPALRETQLQIGAVTILAAVLVIAFSGADSSFTFVMMYLIPAAVLVLAIVPPPAIRQFSASRAITFIGSRSYSFYLLHSLALHATREAARRSSISSPVFWFALSLTFATIAAWLFDRFIDRPIARDPVGVLTAGARWFEDVGRQRVSTPPAAVARRVA